jgi:hypothetical protein
MVSFMVGYAPRRQFHVLYPGQRRPLTTVTEWQGVVRLRASRADRADCDQLDLAFI